VTPSSSDNKSHDKSQQHRRDGVISARTYDYEGEAECDENVKVSWCTTQEPCACYTRDD
jgi:hypothetical protein